MSKVLLMVKEFGNSKRNILLIWGGLVVFLAVAAAVFMFADYSQDVNKGLADNLIRLHVIANSDSQEDQTLKRDVRDAVLGFMKGELEESKDIEQTKYIINHNIDEIAQLSERVLKEKGKGYSVKAMLGSYPFPTKTYGDVTLPAGSYQALRIVIGKGTGANWWCVLFPPLCFVDASHGTIPQSVKEDLKGALSGEEYSIITSTDSDKDIPIKIKFKVVEFFQTSKIKFSGMISKIFK